ncbi:MAG: DUF1501 domain-containing protein [Planctomycetaceae bacterium]|nr:DUF1501 domain-containing protein [Planctomycetaceae bacterium]
MFELEGRAFRCCDQISRRNALKVGFLGLGSLSLADWFRLRAEAAKPGSPAASPAVIFIELAGGPSHFETYDPKPDAPREYRGPLASVATKLPGVRFSQYFEQQAKIADKLAVIRSISHPNSSHESSAHLTQTGFYLRDRQNRENEMPCAGAVAAKMVGAGAAGVPPYVAIPRVMRAGSAAFLGKAFNPFETGGDPSKRNFKVDNLALVKNMSTERLAERRDLLASLDSVRRVVDRQGASGAMDRFTEQAFEMVTGPRARKAFDLSLESDKTRAEYGDHVSGQSLLLARRLVEAGVTFVTVRIGGWDDHQQIATKIKQKGPAYDQGVAALVRDLHRRGLNQQVLVVAMGEFGRTPRVNKTAGRDHWGSAMSVLVAGGGLRMGQVIGSTNSKGETPSQAPYRPENVLAQVYRHLGIDTHQSFVDFSGRPRYVLEEHGLISELG